MRLEQLEQRCVLSTHGLPVIDNFDREDSTTISESWQELTGDFAIADNRLAADRSGTSLAIVDATNEANVAISARVDLTDLVNSQAGLVARYSQVDGTMYVGTLVHAGSNTTAEIWRGRKGDWSVLTAQATTAESGTLKFTVEDDLLRLFFDGALIARARDDKPLEAGAVGLRATDSAVYDDLRIESLRTTEISHTIEDDGRVRLAWLPLPDQMAYHVIVTDSNTGVTRHSGWVYGTSLRLDLPGGQYMARVAASGMPYAEHRLAVTIPIEADNVLDHIVLDSGAVKLFWAPVEGEQAYHLIVKNTDTQVEVFRGWVYGTSRTLALDGGLYSAWVAPSGAAYATHQLGVEPLSEPPLASQTLESVDYTYISPGRATIFWQEVLGVSAYFVTIRDSHNVEVLRGWVLGTQLTVNLEPEKHVVSVAPSGGDAVTISISLAEFSQSTFTPLSPIGQTDRQQNRFTWFPVDGAVAYYFQLRELDGPVIKGHWVHRGTETAASVPPGEYQWRVIPLNARNEQANNTGWVTLSISQTPLVRENLLGIEPHVTVPTHLAKLNVPEVAIRADDGTVYIADTLSNVIRRVRDGQVELFAGTLAAGYNGDGFRTDVMLNRPSELIFDRDGNLIVLDTGNFLIRKIDVTTGLVTTVMGIPARDEMPFDGQAAGDAPIGRTTALAFDEAGNLYVPTYVNIDGMIDNRLFYVSPDGIVHESTVALPAPLHDIRVGNDAIDFVYSGHFQRVYSDGTRRTADLSSQFGGGIVYRADTQTTLVGNHSTIYRFDADFNRTAFAGNFANVADITETDNGVLVTDSDRGIVVEFDHDGRQIAGGSIGTTTIDGIGTIVDIVRYDDDTLLFLDNRKGYVFSYSISTGRTKARFGNGRLEVARLGVESTQTGFWFPNALAVDSQKNVYVSENHRIIKIDTSGQTSLFSGAVQSGDVATEDGGSAVPAGAARYRSIRDLAFAADDTLYVADTFNNKIKTISPDGIVTTIAGSGIAGVGKLGVGQFDMPAIEANLNRPLSVLPLADGTILISNGWSSTLERIETDGMLRHVAGIARTANYQGGGLYLGDGGPATEAFLNTPAGLAVSDEGIIYFADTFNHVIRAIDPQGTITTVWGMGTPGFASDGYLVNYPFSMALVGDDLYLTDPGNGLASRIRLNLVDLVSYYREQTVTQIFPRQDVEAGTIDFQFSRHPLDYAYYFQVYTGTGATVWQKYIYQNWWQMDLAPGDYRWRVTALARINGQSVFAQPSPWFDFSATLIE